MDKVRAFLKVVWKQRFWVLTVLAPLIAAVCWMSASGKLQAEFQANKSTIDGHFSTMQQISSNPIHGNDQVNEAELREAVKISKSVRALWQELYETQREKVLSWPDALGANFKNYIERRPFQSRIAISWRRLYLDYIKKQFDELLQIVDAKKLETAGGVGGMAGLGREGMAVSPEMVGPGGETLVRDYLVDWLDQGELATYLRFGGQVPSSLQVWVAQEDLWVYETLLKVIARTNDARGARRGAENSAIRVIIELQVGAKAALAMNQKGNVVAPAAATGEGVMDPSGVGVDPSQMGDPMAMGDGTGGVDATLLVNRYIGPDGKPIADATAGLGVEYRQLPVRMLLTMDQRWIPKLLVECANAPLPIEVQRVRVNPEQSATGTIGGTGGGMGQEGMMGGRSGFSSGYSSGASGFAGGSANAPPMPPAIAADYATVEIQGLVYIYNEPSAEQLSVPGAEETDAGATPAEGEAAPAGEAAPVGEEVAAAAAPAVG
jgi:hypothetical protein